MNIPLTRIVPLLALLIAGTFPVSAATILYSTTAPTGNMLFSNTANAGTLQWRNTGTGNVREVGSVFSLAAASQLDKITLDISSVGTGAANASATISLVQMTGTAGSTTFSVLQTDTALIPSTIAAPGYLTFDITDRVLSANTSYGFILSFDTSAGSRTVNFFESAATAADYGIQSDQGGAFTLTTSSGNPANLQIYLQGITPIPEPSVPGLVGMACVGLLFVMKLRTLRALR